MSKYVNTVVRINNSSAITHNKIGVISRWDSAVRKYVVDFDNSWIGWYKKKELTIITNGL